MEQQLMNNSTMVVKKLGKVNEFDVVVGSFRSSSSSSSSLSTTSSGSSSSLEFDSFEEVTSRPSSSSSSDQLAHDDPLSDMTSLIQQLPIKRGLSKHYQGKSQSFTSLANVRSLEDLAKPENPYNKKLKCCRSFCGGLDAETHTKPHSSVVSARHHVPTKKGIHSSRGSCSSLSARKGSANSFMGNRPPIPPHRSTSTSTIPNQTALFA